jgi:hypothetical protein
MPCTESTSCRVMIPRGIMASLLAARLIDSYPLAFIVGVGMGWPIQPNPFAHPNVTFPSLAPSRPAIRHRRAPIQSPQR